MCIMAQLQLNMNRRCIMTIKKIFFSILLTTSVGFMAVADNLQGVEIGFTGITGASNTNLGYNYSISTKEISFAQFSASGVGSGDENHWVGSAGTNAPAVYVSYVEAARYCNWLTSGNADTGAYLISGGSVADVDRGYRNADNMVYVLPSLDEFNNAAYFTGSSFNTYANDSNSQPSQTATRYLDETSPWPVGSGDQELNGTYDMMGNVWEWIEGSSVKGGSFSGTAQDIRYTGQNPSLPQTQSTDMLGLRIVAIPEPGTISFMSLSTIGLFLTRSIRRKRPGQTLIPIRREHSCDVFREYDEGAVEVEEDYLEILFKLTKTGSIQLFKGVHRLYSSADKAFWNRMVVIHERKVARRTAFREALRTKALKSFDAFLALIMK